MQVLPLFKSHYSICRSILTFAEAKKLDENYPISVFDIAKVYNLKEVIVVDDSISGFLEAYTNSQKAGVKLIFGLKLRCIEDIKNKSDASLKTLSKVIIFARNSAGYHDLIKISSLACTEGFYYKPNIDFASLKALWSDNLSLAIPFYDSFLFKNALESGISVPNFSFSKPVFFIENSGLPFDGLIQKKVLDYAKSINAEVLLSRSIYYYKKADFVPFLTFRCINERTTLEKPELNHCGSDKFCFEEWQRQDMNPNIVILHK